MSERRVIPFTPPGDNWSQREYVACVERGIGFAAHRFDNYRQAFHYGFPEGVGCTTVITAPSGPEKYIDHDFASHTNPQGLRPADWIERCRQAMASVT